MCSQAAESAEHGGDLLKRVGRLADAAEEILAEARTNKSFGAATSALNAACRLLELCGRLSGELQAPGAGIQVNFTSNKVTVNNFSDDVDFAQMVGEATMGFSIDELCEIARDRRECATRTGT